MEIMDYIHNERIVMHLQWEPDKPDRISWVVALISMWFHKFKSDILSRVVGFSVLVEALRCTVPLPAYSGA